VQKVEVGQVDHAGANRSSGVLSTGGDTTEGPVSTAKTAMRAPPRRMIVLLL
jgi:hypothetical protein